jgi:5-methylcytosine-specific restriction enzyme B
MRESEFTKWLESEGHPASTRTTLLTDAKRIEKYYGDLDDAYDADSFDAVRTALTYTKEDERAGKENPALFEIAGNTYRNLAHYRTVLNYYAEFRRSVESVSDAAEDIEKTIKLFDRTGNEHWPVRQTNRTTGITAFRIMGTSNRTEDAIETTDIVEIGQALFKEGKSVRVLRSNNGRRPYLSYGKQKLVAYEITPELASILGIPAKGSIDDAGPNLDLAILEKMKKQFVERFPDFEPEMFSGNRGAYFEQERNYKNKLLEKAQAAIADQTSLSDEELGARFLDLLIGPDSGLLGWRTDARIKSLRADQPNVLEAEAGSLIRSRDDVIAAAQTFVSNTWPILIEGKEKSLPYSESRNIPSMLLALACPQDALGINTEPLRKIYKALTGRNLFGANPMTSGEHEEILSFAQILFDKFNEWGWQPRDLWDVQSFIWVVRGDTQDEANNSPSNLQEAQRPMSQPTNLILYGPPGTGKTYQTAFEAVALCNGTAPQDRKELTVKYDALVEAGQIRFVTFHQSYSYEDFVEGLRPVTGNEDVGDPSAAAGFRLEPRQGIFREIAALAEQARRNEGRSTGYDLTGKRFFKMSLGRAGSEDHIFDAAIDGGYIVLGWGGDVDWSDSRYDEYQSIFDKWNEIEPGTSGNAGNISQLWTFRSSIKEGDLIIASDGNSNFRAIGEVTGPYEYSPTDVREYNHRRAVKWLLVLDESLPVETIHEGKFTMRSCYELRLNRMKLEALSRLLPGNSAPLTGRPDQFVLIIDEINRANISKVFGELITLIEADKRMGSENMLTVKLPYSGDIFGVPNNLHLLGTMNTADRSIALLDTALRRRFTFKELMPDHTKLAEAAERTGINLPAVLRSLNDRIEFLFDREHQIGHAYLMPCNTVSDVDDVMRFKIIPLLAEYFYEDWSKVALVLGDADGAGNFIERTKLNPPSGIQNEGFEDARYRWVVCDQFSATAYDQFG